MAGCDTPTALPRGSSFFPYGTGGGSARAGTNFGSRRFGRDENLLMRMGGVDANMTLALTIRNNWLINKKLSYDESSLFFLSFSNYRRYISFTKKNDFDGDISRYLDIVNAKYGFTQRSEHRLTLDDLHKRSRLNLINSYQLIAIYSYLKNYLFDGKDEMKLPLIPLGKIEWLPSFRFGLTPFGSEFIIENHFIKDDNLIELEYRLGDNKLDKFWGMGLSYSRKFNENFRVTLNGDLWVQPDMQLGGLALYNTNDGLGGKFTTMINWHPKNSNLGLYTEIGYKTSGFIEGEWLRARRIFRLGLSFKEH